MAIDYGYKVFLGPLEPSYNLTFRRMRNDPLIWRWCRQNNLITESQQERWRDSADADPSIRMFSIIRREPFGDVIGVCGLTSIDLINRRAEFSCYIDPGYQKYGHGRESLMTLFKYGFEEMNLNIIWGETFSDNPAQHLFEKLGMVKEGLRRDFYFKAGKYCDAILYSIKRSEITW